MQYLTAPGAPAEISLETSSQVHYNRAKNQINTLKLFLLSPCFDFQNNNIVFLVQSASVAAVNGKMVKSF